MTRTFTSLTVKHCEANKTRCGWLFINGNVDITQQSIPIFHTRSAKALLCERKALAAKMVLYVYIPQIYLI